MSLLNIRVILYPAYITPCSSYQSALELVQKVFNHYGKTSNPICRKTAVRQTKDFKDAVSNRLLQFISVM